MREWTLCGGPPASGNVLSWEAAVKTAVGNLSGLSVSQVDTATLCSPSSAELTILPFKRDFKQVQYTIVLPRAVGIYQPSATCSEKEKNHQTSQLGARTFQSSKQFLSCISGDTQTRAEAACIRTPSL